MAVAISETVTDTADDVLDVKLLSPEYWAVIELVPVGKDVVANVAVASDELPAVSVPDPSKVVPL